MRRLLWVVCLNAAVVAVAGMAQRLSGTDRLLWLFATPGPGVSSSQFGPFDYYANAAQYLNLVWPVCLGLWWSLGAKRGSAGPTPPRAGGSPRVLLLPASLVIFTAAIFAGSRGGMVVAGGLFVGSALVLLLGSAGASRRMGWVLLIALLGTGVAGASLGGWQALRRALAPSRDFATGLPGGLNDFAIVCRFDCPTSVLEVPWWIAELAPAAGKTRICSTLLYLERSELALKIWDDHTNAIFYRYSSFVSQFGGRTVTAAGVRSGTNLAVYADGVELKTVIYRRGEPRPDARVGSDFLRVHQDQFPQGPAGTPTVHSVRLYAQALSPAEVRALTSPTELGGQDGHEQTSLPAARLSLDRQTLMAPASLSSQLRGRTQIHEIAQRVAADSPWLGTGPGTFRALYPLYSPKEQKVQIGYVHNDWLETRLTFGWIGSGLLLLALFTSVLGGNWCGQTPAGALLGLLWLAQAGCLIHARFDYPLQVHSVLFHFLLWTVLTSLLTRRRP